MAFVPIPKDLARVKTKVVFNLTQRQLVCFGSGVLVGLPLFFSLQDALPGSACVLVMIAMMLPFFLLGMYEKNGLPLERYLHHVIQSRFVRPKRRPYQTDNLYAALMRQAKYEQEVRRIVQKSRKRQQTRKKARGQTDAG